MSGSPSSAAEKVGSYSLKGIDLLWDNLDCVRERMRHHNRVIMHYDPETKKLSNLYVEKTIHNLRHNRLQLQPLFEKMKENDLQLPMIDNVIEEFRNLYMRFKRVVTYDTLYQESWAARRLLSLAKNTVLHRKHLSEDKGTPLKAISCTFLCQGPHFSYKPYSVHGSAV